MPTNYSPGGFHRVVDCDIALSQAADSDQICLDYLEMCGATSASLVFVLPKRPTRLGRLIIGSLVIAHPQGLA
jgi:hypothetical protein